MRQWSWWSREDRSELLFGYAVVQGSLDGCPGVPDGCRWVVRVAVEVFGELLGVISWSSCGLEDEWDQVDAGVSVELFLFFSFGHVTRTRAGGCHKADVSGEWRHNGCINIIRDAP